MGFFSSSNERQSVEAKNWIKSNYGECCALCENLDINNSLNGGWFSKTQYKCYKGWCTLTEKNRCVKEISADPRYGRDFTEVYRLITGRRYFILTAICEILGISFESNFYKEIRALIQLVREDDSTYKEAIGYDSFGPELANRLKMDPNSVEIANLLVQNYLLKVYLLIKQNKQEEAIEIYKEMVEYLFIKYRNIDNYSEIIDNGKFENKHII